MDSTCSQAAANRDLSDTSPPLPLLSTEKSFFLILFVISGIEEDTGTILLMGSDNGIFFLPEMVLQTACLFRRHHHLPEIWKLKNMT
jgi:hypothetical protein